jgi:hypothetical protein
MDTITANAVRKHLDATQAHLNIAGYIPVELSLPVLEDALHELEAAIDTLRQARLPTTAPRFVGLDMATAPDATAVFESQRLADLIAQTKAA